jgi:hypothetical protein
MEVLMAWCLGGQWMNDRRHGQGRFTSAEDGKTYEGTWRDGMRHGNGRFLIGVGGRFHSTLVCARIGPGDEGQLASGLFLDEGSSWVSGSLFLKDGDTLKGNWENGVLVQPLEFVFSKESHWNDPKY